MGGYQREKALIRNSVVCLNCGTEVESEWGHHFNPCKCYKNHEENKGIAVDGGKFYTRLVGNLNGYLWTGQYEDDDPEEAETNRQAALIAARKGKKDE